MLVLFLDVDGVLVHSGTIDGGRTSGEPHGSSFFYAAQVDPACAARLFRLCEATGAKLVVASAWRNFDAQMSGLRRALFAAGFSRRPWIGSTGTIPGALDGPARRAAECQQWLDTHPEAGLRSFVLDDGWVPGFLQLEARPAYFAGGLLDVHVEEAIRLLNGADSLCESLSSSAPQR
jgi:hypothetical protein